MDISNINHNSTIVILTGAGISRESGLSTFRGEGGLWQGVRVEDVATPEAFRHNPEMVHEFYNTRKKKLLNNAIEPNAAHLALAKLERNWQGRFLLVTQNVDNLHERAGSERLIHMHGELLKARCEKCAEVFPWIGDMDVHSVCPDCHYAGSLRVDVVWFGEMPMKMDEIYMALGRCDLFISIGTSGNVYPAAGFVDTVSQKESAMTVEINLEPSLNAAQFSAGCYGPATEVVSDFVDELLKKCPKS